MTPSEPADTTAESGPLLSGPWQHRNVAANGIRFHVALGTSFGPDRPLVLLLHGFGEFWWAWRHQIPELDAAGLAVAAMDLRGYGASDKTPRGYDPATTAADVAGVIRSLGHREAVVVGHDTGGAAGWATAAYAPSQVRALAVVAVPHPLAHPWLRGLLRSGYLQLPLLPERRIVADNAAYIEQLLRSGAADASWLSAADARHYREAMLLWPSPQCALEYHRAAVRNRLRGAGREFRRALQRPSAAPVLSVHGQDDPQVPRAAMAAAAGYVTGRHDLVALPGVGHLPHEEAPEEFTRVLLTWLGSVRPTPTRRPARTSP